jgi:hypothetical protein
MAAQTVGDVHEDRRTDGHQHVGAQARRALPVLALKPNDSSKDKGGDQAHRCVGGRREVDVLDGLQGAPLGRSNQHI